MPTPQTLQPYHPNAEIPGAPKSLATMHELTPDDVVAQVVKIQQVMERAMQKDEHYGVIPGTGSKPSLLKAGAEKLCLLFRLDPQYEIVEKTQDDSDHLTIISRCTLYHIPTGNRMGSGMGSCSTMEKKYRYRTAKRACPKCSAEAINRSKFPPKDKRLGTAPGWYCYAKQGGCGTEFAAGDGAIINQPMGQIPNPDLPDQWNTVLKMANKRSLVAAVLNVTAASDIFTQDLEDYPMTTAPAPTVVNVLNAEAVQSLIKEPGKVVAVEPDEIVIADEPEPEPEETRPDVAPLQEWLDAFAHPQTAKGLLALWKGCTAPDVWKWWSDEEQMSLCEAHGAAWDRLLLAASDLLALQAMWTAITPPTGKAIWTTWSAEEQEKRKVAKDTAKKRLTPKVKVPA